jgi:NHL repeat
VSTFAGQALNSGSVDGTRSTARFNHPAALAADAAGNLYVADTYNDSIRKITAAGVVTTLAGSAGITGSNDGTGSNALFSQPYGVTVDGSGNVYVADTGNSTIRQISPTGVVTTVAGIAGIAGLQDGAGASALFNQPRSLIFDGNGGIAVADTGNALIRFVLPDATVASPALVAAPASNPAPVPPPIATPSATPADPASSSSGGGGAVEPSFIAALLLLTAIRRIASRENRDPRRPANDHLKLTV